MTIQHTVSLLRRFGLSEAEVRQAVKWADTPQYGRLLPKGRQGYHTLTLYGSDKEGRSEVVRLCTSAPGRGRLTLLREGKEVATLLVGRDLREEARAEMREYYTDKRIADLVVQNIHRVEPTGRGFFHIWDEYQQRWRNFYPRHV